MVNEKRPGAEGSAVNGPVADYQSISRAAPAASADGGSCVAVLNGGESVVAKRKRGRPPKNGVAGSSAKKSKKDEEDVCFICFDGGKLVLCDRRVCPKAYHPTCVKHDESFFKRRARWNCGWHYCNICLKNAVFMCYMCPYSLCEACVKQADISCVRGKKGFCKTCMGYVSQIENITQGNEEVGHLDFDDTTRWEHLFKAYWVYLKQKESLNLDELTRATNPWKGPVLNHENNPSREPHNTVNRNVDLSSTPGLSGKSNTQVEVNDSKRRKTRSRKQPQLQKDIVVDKLQKDVVDWASNELLEFVAHVKNGDTSKLNKFDVQALLLEYIRRNKLRDSNRKCQVICDKRLKILFGKVQVGHFEMLKLLEYHFKEGSCASGVVHAATVDSSPVEMKVEQRSEEENDEGEKQVCGVVDERERPINMDIYAAIDVHNMKLIYLRRSLVENLMDDTNSFRDKVVGSIVRIRISGNDLQEMYRLVRVVGTSKAAQPYKTGDRTADIVIKILNLDRIEDARIDAISNQDFSEGEVHKKAVALQEVRIKDALQTEILKLNQIRDCASKMGHRKEVRECLEKLELLKSPEEFQRRMSEMPEVHSDPRMGPDYQSDKGSEHSDTKKQDLNMPPKLSDSSCAEPSTPQSVDMSDSTRENVCKEDDNAAARSHENSQCILETDAARILEELRNQVDPSRIISKQGSVTPNHGRDISDASVSSSSSSALSPVNNAELEKAWHYRDPLGNVQGPFCMLQLRNWDSGGYFPVDLRVWRIDESQDKSVLLRDVLLKQYGNGHQFQSDCLDYHKTEFVSEHSRQRGININAVWTSDEPNDACDSDIRDPAQCPDDKKQTVSGRDMVSSVQVVSAACPAIKAIVECSKPPTLSPENNKNNSQSFTVEPGPFGDKPSSRPKMPSGGPAFLDLLSSSSQPEQHQENLKSQIEENKVGFDLESEPMEIKSQAEQNYEEIKSQAAEFKQSVASYLTEQQPCSSWDAFATGTGFSAPVSSEDQGYQGIKGLSTENAGIGWTSATSVVCETIQMVGYSMLPESCVVELDPGVASGMPAKFSHLVTSTSEGCQFTHSSSAHPDCNMSSWIDGPIELSTLGDDSVSELLSQVEALESLNGMPCSNAQIDFGDDTIESPSNDCFGQLVGFSPQLESGKHDAWGSTCDIQFNSQPMVTEQHLPYQANLHGCPSNPSDGQQKAELASIEQDFLSLTCASLPPHVPAVSQEQPIVCLDMLPPPSMSLSPPRPSLPASPPPRPLLPASPLAPLQPPPPPQPSLPVSPPPRPLLAASPLPLLQPPSSKVDAPSSPVEEGEVDPKSLSSELSVQIPVADSPKRSFPRPRFSPREKGDSLFSSREKGDALLSPREKGDSLFSSREKGDALLSSREKGDALLSSREKGDASFSPQEKGDALFSPQEKGDALFSSREKGDALFSPREKGDALFSPREKGDALFSPREKGDALFSPREKGDALFSSREKGDAWFSPRGRGDVRFSPREKEKGDALFSPRERGDTLLIPREKGDAIFSPREKGDAWLSSREKGDARFSPREKGDAKPAAYSTPRIKLSSPDPRPLLPTPKPISDRHLKTGTARAAVREIPGSGSTSGTRQDAHRSSLADRGSYHGSGARQDHRSYQLSADPVFAKGGSRSARQRQPLLSGSGGGGAPRQPLSSSSHRGQRVCKFYESGYCRKGASCNYLHP